jgi:hypothetical protein
MSNSPMAPLELLQRVVAEADQYGQREYDTQVLIKSTQSEPGKEYLVVQTVDENDLPVIPGRDLGECRLYYFGQIGGRHLVELVSDWALPVLVEAKGHALFALLYC